MRKICDSILLWNDNLVQLEVSKYRKFINIGKILCESASKFSKRKSDFI